MNQECQQLIDRIDQLLNQTQNSQILESFKFDSRDIDLLCYFMQHAYEPLNNVDVERYLFQVITILKYVINKFTPSIQLLNKIDLVKESFMKVIVDFRYKDLNNHVIRSCLNQCFSSLSTLIILNDICSDTQLWDYFMELFSKLETDNVGVHFTMMFYEQFAVTCNTISQESHKIDSEYRGVFSKLIKCTGEIIFKYVSDAINNNKEICTAIRVLNALMKNRKDTILIDEIVVEHNGFLEPLYDIICTCNDNVLRFCCFEIMNVLSFHFKFNTELYFQRFNMIASGDSIDILDDQMILLFFETFKRKNLINEEDLLSLLNILVEYCFHKNFLECLSKYMRVFSESSLPSSTHTKICYIFLVHFFNYCTRDDCDFDNMYSQIFETIYIQQPKDDPITGFVLSNVKEPDTRRFLAASLFYFSMKHTTSECKSFSYFLERVLSIYDGNLPHLSNIVQFMEPVLVVFLKCLRTNLKDIVNEYNESENLDLLVNLLNLLFIIRSDSQYYNFISDGIFDNFDLTVSMKMYATGVWFNPLSEAFANNIPGLAQEYPETYIRYFKIYASLVDRNEILNYINNLHFSNIESYLAMTGIFSCLVVKKDNDIMSKHLPGKILSSNFNNIHQCSIEIIRNGDYDSLSARKVINFYKTLLKHKNMLQASNLLLITTRNSLELLAASSNRASNDQNFVDCFLQFANSCFKQNEALVYMKYFNDDKLHKALHEYIQFLCYICKDRNRIGLLQGNISYIKDTLAYLLQLHHKSDYSEELITGILSSMGCLIDYMLPEESVVKELYKMLNGIVKNIGTESISKYIGCMEGPIRHCFSSPLYMNNIYQQVDFLVTLFQSNSDPTLSIFQRVFEHYPQKIATHLSENIRDILYSNSEQSKKSLDLYKLIRRFPCKQSP